MPPAKRTIRRLRIGQELKALRVSRGLKLEEAAKLFGRSTGSLSKIETGNQRLYPRDLHAFFDAYEVTDQSHKAELLRLVGKSIERAYPAEYADIVRSTFDDYLSLERDAAKIASYVEVIPGLFQTPEYAKCVVEASREWAKPEQVEKFVRLRMNRQSVLQREDPAPPEVSVVLGERALRQNVGGPDVMREQLQHLLHVGRLENVALQLLPFSAGPHVGDNGQFTYMGFRDEPGVVVIESLHSALYLEAPEVVAQYEKAGEHLRMTALSPRQTAARIRDILESEWTT
ncbi:helix-turn-helix transcriptional regulator [Streptomyces sp. SID3343]|uniref:helix-turn-helix domain-containing protein n=1 Tax=Streptomyces sp. SID3343 TaxID=2690260 RepID=UPI001371EC4C|nr:helix-turn-helix transcriptional regulator [Streptomyces sp. SID3343]MYV99097.1 helix-turn-helix domain-containing protein [Streptomyces sp. SID3343]